MKTLTLPEAWFHTLQPDFSGVVSVMLWLLPVAPSVAEDE